MKKRIKRPPSVWLTQTVLIFSALFWLYSSVRTIARFGGEIYSLVLAIRVVLLISGVFLLLVIPLWGLVKRRVYGRWLGVLTLSLLWVYLLNGQIHELTGGAKNYHPRELGALILFVTLNVLVNLFVLVLALRLACAKRISEFFSKDVELT